MMLGLFFMAGALLFGIVVTVLDELGQRELRRKAGKS
jgi:hypothetical protein